ncbi:hypothetical protein ZHAS_00018512 [Anopheles sinensis]|uniref:Uncharacterized protein n=1 Tax=Anopheles sinensis TaxID=74873 RepID=A0A084WJT3_ANOSI|nr:hypothetical protein ZHAS_00018512 [Anopheles sinensis]
MAVRLRSVGRHKGCLRPDRLQTDHEQRKGALAECRWAKDLQVKLQIKRRRPAENSPTIATATRMRHGRWFSQTFKVAAPRQDDERFVSYSRVRFGHDLTIQQSICSSSSSAFRDYRPSGVENLPKRKNPRHGNV